MPRQIRAETTRHNIIAAAVDVFGHLGYGRASLNDIISGAGVTKGSLYFHFDSKEALARAVIDASVDQLRAELTNITSSRAPALEKFIHCCFVTAVLFREEALLRTGGRLLLEIGDFRGAEGESFQDWTGVVRAVVQAAVDQGDIDDGLDLDELTSGVTSALSGAFFASEALGGRTDVVGRLETVWRLLVRAAVPPAGQSYFQEFLSRETATARAGAVTPDADTPAG
ncbi:TetR/AcrR family transcriptional regulator [Rhodococcus sp. D2-41]|uniref:TetR/AcrR family transcriptional regulator n=1 Tax=Speluncibacter jeojiensis TaxID=2710754 RepID=A0A9X4REH8_9ACTN|nr:ScbR family autoregulator-binding transcription factor [Rhodococcus sp. D2-41]MDG3010271.1 TetR/AcrR family transcriptional regulator [Rhodococcus sp. D2-41]MDG3015784.1 TetR/AcrR family transcriptional regulator [Corynebacteriales bacterium D3-21]